MNGESGPISLSIQLASATVLILLIFGTPLAWWLANTRSRWKTSIEAVTALPLVLPPTVLGFYLLILFSKDGAIGSISNWIFGSALTFHFSGLVIASCLYSLPFVVQPLQAAFEALDRRTIEAAWTLGAHRLRVFRSIVLPQTRRGFIVAIVLGFAHTLGEFGVVLMVGGNIPGETQVVSIALYEQVETLRYEEAHRLAAGLLIFSFIVLWIVYTLNRKQVGNFIRE